jgi:hypothetical protein
MYQYLNDHYENSISSQEREGVSSAECFSDIPASVLLRLNLTAEKSCCNASETESYQSFRYGMTCEHSTANRGEEKSISCAEASRAKTLASLESSAAWGKAQDPASGPRLSDLLASYDRATSSWRTSQHCLLAQAKNEADGLAEFSETWPSAGMMRNGKTYQRQPWALPIAENASGLLPTPTKSDAKGSPRNRWNGNEKSHGNLCEVLRDGPNDPIYPHPDFVEQMMGFPTGWTDLQHSATP